MLFSSCKFQILFSSQLSSTPHTIDITRQIDYTQLWQNFYFWGRVILAKRLAMQIGVYIVGLFILSLGAPFALNSELGIPPVNSLPFVISFILEMPPGTVLTWVLVAFIILQILILRRDFELKNLSQIIFSFIFGYFINFAIFLVGDFSLPTYLGQLAMMGLSILAISFGLSTYMEARLINMSPEALVWAIVSKIPNGTFPPVKIVFDVTLVSTALILSLVFLGGLYGVREGTIISALLIGRLIPLARKIVVRVLTAINFYEIVGVTRIKWAVPPQKKPNLIWSIHPLQPAKKTKM